MINKSIINTLSNVPKDKLLHFFYGAIIALPLTIILNLRTVFIIMLIIAIVKEVDDNVSGRSKISLMDIIFIVAPVTILILSNYFL